MALRKIARLGEPVLRQVARRVDASEIGSSELETLIDDLIETMRDANGAGLAAPQIYESVAVCVMEVRNNPRYPELPPLPLQVLINPVVTALVGDGEALLASESITMYEGCLSVPGLRGRVRRPRSIELSCVDRLGNPIRRRYDGIHAAVVQHETDHLAGRLFVDRVDPSTLAFIQEYERYVPASERVCDGA